MVSAFTIDEVGATDINQIDKYDRQELNSIIKTSLSRPELPSFGESSEVICLDYTGQGLLRICYKNNTDDKLMVKIEKGKEKVCYPLLGDGRSEDFPLQYGNGTYFAHILKNVGGNAYVTEQTCAFNVYIEDPNVVFLNSVQNIKWNYDMEPIKKVEGIIAKTLHTGNESFEYSCVYDIYKYIIKNINYDYDKINYCGKDYIPNIEQIYTDGSGICYDYASLFAAMLRSIGIPTKLVKGYADYMPNTYHAWNEVFVDGEWITIDVTYDAIFYIGGNPKFMEKNKGYYSKVYEY